MAGPYHGWEAKIYKDAVLIGYATSITVDVTPNIDGVFELGSRLVQEWKPGNLEISGTLERLWIDGAYLDDVKADSPTEYTIECKLTDSAGVTQTATLTGVVFTSFSGEIPEDGLVTESIDFSAKDISFV